MRRQIAAIVIALLVAACTVLGATPAQAATCNSGTFCLYDNVNVTGLMYAARVLNYSTNVCITLPAAANNKTSYVRNRENVDLLVYDDPSCSSAPGVIHALSSGQMRSPWADTISAWCYCT